jgi:hypothetical protein
MSKKTDVLRPLVSRAPSGAPAADTSKKTDVLRPLISRAPSSVPAVANQGTDAPRPQMTDAPPVAEPEPGLGAESGSNTLAKVSVALVVLFGAVISPITLITGFIARSQIKRTGQGGADLALAAMVVSFVFLGIAVLSYALVRYGATQYSP